MHWAKPHFAILAIIIASAAWPHDGLAQPALPGGDSATVAAIEQSLVDVIARAERSVVAVARSMRAEQPAGNPQLNVTPQLRDLFGDLRQQVARAESPRVTAAGVIIDPVGLILTEYLAVREDGRHTVTTVDGSVYPATIKAADPRSGLAVLSIAAARPQPRAGEPDRQPPSSFPSIPFGDASQLRKGQFVVAIGNPYAIRSDGEPTASWGIVTNLARKAPVGTNLNDISGAGDAYRTTIHHLGTLIQTDAKLGWSAGGGALVNRRGELVGLTTTISTIAGHERPAGYAIPIDHATGRIIDTLKEGREVEYGLLGVTFSQRVTPVANRRNGAVAIGQVVPGSPAARAGLQSGDVITQVAGRTTADIDAIQLAISVLPPSQAVAIDYVRGDSRASVTVKLAKLSVPGRKIVTNRPPSLRGMWVDYSTTLDRPAMARMLASGTADQGDSVVVTEVEPDSAAWRAGVRPGMFVSHVGSQRVTTPAEFRTAIEAAGEIWNLRLLEPTMQPTGPALEIEIRDGK